MPSISRDTGSPRPGGRTARTRRAVHQAALDIVFTQGYGQLTVERVARAAGVHPTTVYRRWETSAGVLTDLADDYLRELVDIPDTGTLHGDLTALCLGIRSLLVDSPVGPLVRALVAASESDASAGTLLGASLLARHEAVSLIVDNAVARGEVPPDADAARLLESLGGPFYLRLLVTHRDLTPDFARAVAESVAIAAGAGAFSP